VINNILDKNLALEAVRVTEAAALSSSLMMGKGDEHAADQKAVNSMRHYLNNLSIDGTVVIGEGERDKAPMLYIGEKVGAGGDKIDIALDPLEGTTITAKGGENAMSVLAMAGHKGFLHSPDVYMEKIAVGKKFEGFELDFNIKPDDTIKKLSEFSKISIDNLVVCILDRPRHEELIKLVRNTGARIKLIQDGDVSAVIATTIEKSGVDIYMGSGGAPEGVLAAAALRCMGGNIIGQLLLNTDDEKDRAKKCGISDFNKVYSTTDMASGDVMFAATGVTDGTLLKGVRIYDNVATTSSIVMRSKTKTIRFIEAEHNLTKKKIIK